MNNDVYIVAGGTSLKGFDFTKLKNKDVIVINKSILDVPFAQIFITMDYTFFDYIEKKTNNILTKESFLNFPAKKYFVVATDNGYIKYRNGNYIDMRSNYVYDLNAFDEIVVSHISKGIGGNFYEFVHGCNSGYCSLQLAIILGYKTIHLLGFDLYAIEQTHYHGGYEQSTKTFIERLNFYYPYYLIGLHNIKLNFPNIKIYNYSKESRLNKLLEYKSPEEIT